MKRRSRRLLAVALTPLLVFLLSGWTMPGGWFCADGVRCEPVLRAGCCCDQKQAALFACGEATGAVFGADCGCYYERPSVDASVTAKTWYSHPEAAFPAASFQPDSPRPWRCAEILPSPDRGPPGDSVLSRDSRGPPLA